jgi:hypothetical protein
MCFRTFFMKCCSRSLRNLNLSKFFISSDLLKIRASSLIKIAEILFVFQDMLRKRLDMKVDMMGQA